MVSKKEKEKLKEINKAGYNIFDWELCAMDDDHPYIELIMEGKKGRKYRVVADIYEVY